MSHPLGLPPLNPTSDATSRLHASASGVHPLSPVSPSSGGAVSPSSNGAAASIACDYLSFGCPRSFASEADLDTHLSHAVHTQKHLTLVQSAYVALHKQFDLEKAAIESSRAQLHQEQTAHKSDVLRAQEDQRQAKSALAAVRATAEEFSQQLHREEERTRELTEKLQKSSEQVAQLQAQARTTAELTAQLEQRGVELRNASEQIVHLQQQARAASDQVLHLQPQLSSLSSGGMSLEQHRELQDVHATLKHEVVQLRHQLHTMHLHQAPPPSHTDEDWSRLVVQAQEAQRAVGELQQERDQMRAERAQTQAQLVQLSSLNATQSTELTSLRKAVQDLTDRLSTAEEAQANAVTAFSPVSSNTAQQSSASPPTDSERAAWAAQKRHLETRLMKYEPFSPISPQASPRDTGAQAAGGAQAFASWPTPTPPVPSTPGGTARPLSPRTAALQGYTDAVQPHMAHHRTRSSYGGAGAAGATGSPVAGMSTLATSAALTAAAGLGLPEKRRLLSDKVTGLEAAKQATTARLEAYLGAEVVYWEVTVDKGQLGTLAQPTMAMGGNGRRSNGGSNSLPPIPPSSSTASWSNDPSASAPSSASSASAQPSKSAMFIGLSLQDDSILLSGASATSHPSMQRPPASMLHLPGHHPGSYGYCSLNGHLYDGRGKAGGKATGEYAYGPPYARGDTIGVGWNVSARQIFFTRNGVHLGIAAYEVELAPFHACVAVVSETGSEGFTMNFGDRPFLWRGLALRDPALKLDTQHFLYTAPPCVGIELDRGCVSTACLQLHSYQAPGNGGLEVADLAAESSDGEYTDGGDAAGEGAGEGETRVARREAKQPPLLSAVLILPPPSTMQMDSFGDNTSRAFVTPASQTGGSSRKESIAICYSKQSLLPLLELSVTLHAPLLLQSSHSAQLQSLSLHAYIKDSALGNFKVVSSTERVTMNDPRLAAGELSLTLTAVHQAQPSRHLMVVVNGVDSSGQRTMLGVSDEIVDLSALVHERSMQPITCALAKDGRHIHPSLNVSITVHRVTGGRPSRRRERRVGITGGDQLARTRTRSSGSGGAHHREASPTSSPYPSRPGTVASMHRASGAGAAGGDPRSPHLFEHSVEAMFQNSPSSSVKGSRSGTPFGFEVPAAAGTNRRGSPPSTPGGHRSMVSTPNALHRRVSVSFDHAAGGATGGEYAGWSNAMASFSSGNGSTSLAASPIRPHPPAQSRTPSSTSLARGNGSGPPGGASSGNALLDAEELELQPLTKKLSKLYHEYRRVTARLAHVREEVAHYLEEEENTLFSPAPSASTSQGPQLTQQQQIAHMKRNLAAGLPQHAGLPAPQLQHSGGKPLRTSMIGVGPGAEAELDAFVAAGGGAYGALFHIHVLTASLPASHRFTTLRQVIPLVQKQQARLQMTWVERMKMQEEAIDTSCLFQ